jgi:hypothetical protein
MKSSQVRRYPGLQGTSGTPQHAYGGNAIAFRPETDFTVCAYPQSFIAMGRLKRSMNPCDMRILARLARDGIAGRGLDGMALSPGLPAATAAVAAEAFKKVRRFMAIGFPSKLRVFYLP